MRPLFCVVLLLFSPGVRGNLQKDLVSSFLSKPWLLSNLSFAELPPSQNNLVTLSLSVDNWTPYVLSAGLGSSALVAFIPVRNIDPLDRTFAARTASKEATAGLAGWHVIDPSKNGKQVGRITIAWSAQRNEDLKFGAFIGDNFMDSITGLLEEGNLPSEEGTSVSFQGVTNGKPIILRRDKILLALEANELRKGYDYLLKVSLIHPNVDVWWWKKYYGNKESTTSTTSTSSSSSKPPRNVNPYREEERRQRRKEGDANIPPIFERQELLPPIQLVKTLNVTDARQALLSETRAFWIAIGLQIENWSRRKIVEMSRQFESGRVFRSVPKVMPGTRDLAIITHEERSLSGTLGLIRYKIEPFDTILSIMWSVPYNRQLWKSWAAIGLTNSAQAPSIEDMYSGTDISRFVREKTGVRFEFSDGKRFIVSAEMDGGLTYKPILKICLVPFEKRELANTVKRQLGIPLHKHEDISDSPPQIRLVQSSSTSESPENLQLSKTLFLFIISLTYSSM